MAKAIGSRLTAGTLNQTGGFVMRAEKVGADTLLAQIVQTVALLLGNRRDMQHLIRIKLSPV
jgi:Cu+-exporting ATPase